MGTAGEEENLYFQAKIVNCYAAGAVLGDSSTGGLVGRCLGDSSITGCYYDSVVTGCSGEGNQWGTPRTTAEMKRQATFAGWDFDTVWGIVEEHTYPYLQWQGQAGFTVAPAQPGNKTAGKAFELNITGATDVSGSYLGLRQTTFSAAPTIPHPLRQGKKNTAMRNTSYQPRH